MQLIPHNLNERADSWASGYGGLTLPLPQAVFWVCSPSAPDNSLQMKLVDHLTVSGWLKQHLPVNSPSSTLLLTMLLHWNSCFFNMSLNFFFLLFIFPFPGYLLPHLWALLSCPSTLFNVTLLFSLKFPLSWLKSLGHKFFRVGPKYLTSPNKLL